MIFNSKRGYGWVAMLLHWFSVLLIVGLFLSGLWMVELDYYNSWYIKAPWVHKSVGVIFFFLVLVRLLWRLFNITPAFESSVNAFERMAARIVQFLLYGLMLSLPVSGYLMATAKGNPVDVLGWFSVPVIMRVDNSGDVWSEIHEVMAWALIALALLHAAAAFKHHFFNKDKTLLKMLGLAKGDENV